jgi:hypothetical protein
LVLLAAAARVSVFLAAIITDPATARNVEPAAQQADAPPTTRFIRSTSGTRGRQEGNRYVIEDPRSAFVPATDRQIIVFFEWEAPIGTHHCEARWKDPSGTVVLSSPVDYKTNFRRFGLYWSSALPETAPRGLWAVEALVDGAPAGTHTFEVRDSAPPPPSRRILSQGEIYQRVTASVATMESLGAGGESLGRGPAVALDADHVITAFPYIDGATTLRLGAGSGPLQSTEVGAWDRRNGWAMLRFPGHGLVPMSRSSRVLGVGDQRFVLDSQDEGRVIGEAVVVGLESSPTSRPRLSTMFVAGSPVLDENGDLEGIVVMPSATEQLGSSSDTVSGLRRTLYGERVMLTARLPPAPTASVGLAELDARGEFMKPLSREQRYVISGVFAGSVKRGGAVPMPQEQKVQFSRREKELFVFIQWDPQVKKDTLARLDVYNSDYRLTVKGVPTKMKFRPGTLLVTTWPLAIDQLPPDVYRADVILGEAPVWRGYVRVTD